MASSDSTLAVRFWSKVDQRGSDECWPWKASRHPKGYGHIRVGGRRGSIVGAHRVAHELGVGPVPDGLLVLHSCDNPPCCNPKHLWLGTNDDNMDDMVAKGRQSRLAIEIPPQRRARGERSGNAKLTTKEVLAIRADSRPSTLVGPDFGVDPSLVRYIRRRKIWKHV